MLISPDRPSPLTYRRSRFVNQRALTLLPGSFMVYVSQHILLSCRENWLTLQITSKSYHMSANNIATLTERINRLKVVLVEQNRTGKWLAEQLGKNEATISRWCSNSAQPSLEMLIRIASILNVDPRELINGNSIK